MARTKMPPLGLRNCRIGVIGLGYVGLPLAVEFGKKRPVVGFDINVRRVAELQSGQDHTLEVEPEELAAAAHLRCTTDIEALRACNVFIVTVPTLALFGSADPLATLAAFFSSTGAGGVLVMKL